MFRLALILFGGDTLVRRWRVFYAMGWFVFLCGVVVIADLFDGAADLAGWMFGFALLAYGLVDLVIGSTHSGSRRRFEMLRGAAMLVFACLLLDFPWDNSIAAGVLFAGAFAFNGVVRIASSLLVRFPGWRGSQAVGWGYLVMALLLVTSWPLPDSMNVPFCTGLALMAGGLVLARGAWRLKRLPPGSRLAAISLYRRRHAAVIPEPVMPVDATLPADGEPMVVHVWTAIHQAEDRIRLPLIDRYIAALSRKGSVTTGHVALECGELYISHHPRVRLTITQQNLLDKVRATEGNDHPGMWLPTYAGEAANTQPSTFRIRFRVFNRAYLQAFWDAYRQDDTYNLTSRNCSVVVTEAVDAALEGVFADKPFWRTLLRLALHPDVWLASSTRVRAESIAWTPGLALDYVSALRRITHPRQDLTVQMLRWFKFRERHLD